MSIDRVQGNRTSSRAGLDTLFASGSLTGLTDAQLVDAFLDRSEPQLAFAMIVERHGGMVLRVCRAILRNEADAEDALQVTFLVLASKAPSLRNRTSLAAWLHAVATRTARSARRGLARRRNLEANAVVKSQPHDRQSDNDLREQLQREVAKLPERLREVVVLREFEGLTEEQTAGQLGCAEGTVKSRLFRARKRLRARLENRGWDATGVFAPLAAPTLSLPANLVGSITDLSVSSGSSIPARLLVWRSMVLKGMLMKNVLSLATIALVVSIPVGSGWLIARAGKPDETKTQVSPTPKAAQAAEEERVATLYATLAKSQVALAEALVNSKMRKGGGRGESSPCTDIKTNPRIACSQRDSILPQPRRNEFKSSDADSLLRVDSRKATMPRWKGSQELRRDWKPESRHFTASPSPLNSPRRK